jgi:hypothetical protein
MINVKYYLAYCRIKMRGVCSGESTFKNSPKFNILHVTCKHDHLPLKSKLCFGWGPFTYVPLACILVTLSLAGFDDHSSILVSLDTQH